MALATFALSTPTRLPVVILVNDTADSTPIRRLISASAGISKEKIAIGLFVRFAAL